MPSADDVAGIGDLPAARREYLLRYHAMKWGHEAEQVAEIVRAAAGTCCRIVEPASEHVTAVLGDDGRYHLCVGGKPACAGRKARATQRGYRHIAQCHWWYLDGIRRFTNSRPVEAAAFVVDSAWTVRIDGDEVAADLVAPHLRCPVSAGTSWPPVRGSATPIGRIRARLVELFGPHCAICRRPAQYVDHDHATGLVRGLLCEFCNVTVDTCPHLTGCAFADYLTHPPALPLTISYPNRGRARPRPMPGPAQRAARRTELAALRASHLSM